MKDRNTNSLGDIYVFIVTDAKDFVVETRTGERVGFDFGLKRFFTASDGDDIISPMFFAQNAVAIKNASKNLSHKKNQKIFFAGQLTVCRIFGGRSRKVLLTLALRELEAAIPVREEYADRIKRYTPDRTVFAASSETAESLYALLHRAEDGTLTLLYLDATEKAVKIMRYYNAAAVTRA